MVATTGSCMSLRRPTAAVKLLDGAISVTTGICTIPFGIFAAMLMYRDIVPGSTVLKLGLALPVAACTAEGKRRLMRFFNQHFAANMIGKYEKININDIKNITLVQAVIYILNLLGSIVGSSFYAYCSVVALENASAMFKSYDNKTDSICGDILDNQAVRILCFSSNMVANMIGFLPFNVPATKGIIDALGKLNPCYSKEQTSELCKKAYVRHDIREFIIALNALITCILTANADENYSQQLSAVERIFNQINVSNRRLCNPQQVLVGESSEVDPLTLQASENTEVVPLMGGTTLQPSECLAKLGIIAGFMITGLVYLGFAEFIGISLQMADDANLASVRYPIMIIEVVVSYLLVFATNFMYGPMIFERVDKVMNKKVDFIYMTPKQHKLLLLKNFLICLIGTPPMVYMTKYMAKMSLFWVIFAAIGSFGFEMGGSLARMTVVQIKENEDRINKLLLDPNHKKRLDQLVDLARQLDELQS